MVASPFATFSHSEIDHFDWIFSSIEFFMTIISTKIGLVVLKEYGTYYFDCWT
jgi:hypothetical protein